jgi:glycosyltransferase
MVSVVTITFNNFLELKSTLDSIPEKDYIESIVINGGNDSKTIDFLKNHNGLVINEKDNGIADAFNKGLANASGDYIMFLNSGDILIDPGYIKAAINILSRDSEIFFVHSNIIFHDRIGGEIFMRPQMKSVGRGQPYFHPTMIVRRKCFDEIGKFNEKYKISMDFDFIVRMMKKGYKCNYVDGEAVVRMEGTGKSSAQESEAIKECYKSLKENDYLTLTNQTGYIIRQFFYFGRKIMEDSGLKNLLRVLKRKKHSE